MSPSRPDERVTLAFDVYGTLIDPHAVREALERHVGDEADRLSRLWRDKQLEYSFRRAAMGAYRDFSVVTRDALDTACEMAGVELAADARTALLAGYRTLPAFHDVPGALDTLRERGHAMHAFSNGLPADLASLLEHAGLDARLDGVVSVHDVETFKPDPRVYARFNEVTGSRPADTWLVSSNPFDVIGAVAVGWRAAWVRRTETNVFDTWEHAPSAVLRSLAELPALLDDS